ncbi:hypothetical protein Tco_0993438 [Tanacetum coccineum]
MRCVIDVVNEVLIDVVNEVVFDVVNEVVFDVVNEVVFDVVNEVVVGMWMVVDQQMCDGVQLVVLILHLDP